MTPQQTGALAIPEDELRRIAGRQADTATPTSATQPQPPKRSLRRGLMSALREIVDDVIEDAVDPF